MWASFTELTHPLQRIRPLYRTACCSCKCLQAAVFVSTVWVSGVVGVVESAHKKPSVAHRQVVVYGKEMHRLKEACSVPDSHGRRAWLLPQPPQRAHFATERAVGGRPGVKPAHHGQLWQQKKKGGAHRATLSKPYGSVT